VGLACSGLAKDRNDRLIRWLFLYGTEQGLFVNNGTAVGVTDLVALRNRDGAVGSEEDGVGSAFRLDGDDG